MWQSAQQVRFRLDPPQDLLVGYEELDVAGGPKVAYPGAAKVADKTDVRYEDAGNKNENQGCSPSGNLVRADTIKR